MSVFFYVRAITEVVVGNSIFSQLKKKIARNIKKMFLFEKKNLFTEKNVQNK